jgi:hypothetical protein
MATIGVSPKLRFPTSWFWAVAWLVGIVGWLLMDWDSITRLFRG